MTLTVGHSARKRPNRFLKNENGFLPLFEQTESFKERVVESTTKIIRSELDVLNKKVKAFGGFDPTTNPEDLDLQNLFKQIKDDAPNTFQLLHSAAENKRRQDQYKRYNDHGRIITIVSMLSLWRAKITANSFARTLGLYLYTGGVPRRVLTLLNNLGFTDSYLSIRRAVEAIKQSSQGSSPPENKPSKYITN